MTVVLEVGGRTENVVLANVDCVADKPRPVLRLDRIGLVNTFRELSLNFTCVFFLVVLLHASVRPIGFNI